METGACNHLLSSRMKEKDNPRSLQNREMKQPEPPPQKVRGGKKRNGDVCASPGPRWQQVCSALCTSLHVAGHCGLLPSARCLRFPRGPGNPFSLIVNYNHHNLDPNASRRLQSSVLWTCCKRSHNLLMPTIKKRQLSKSGPLQVSAHGWGWIPVPAVGLAIEDDIFIKYRCWK